MHLHIWGLDPQHSGQYVQALDLVSAYWQVTMHPIEHEKTVWVAAVVAQQQIDQCKPSAQTFLPLRETTLCYKV